MTVSLPTTASAIDQANTLLAMGDAQGAANAVNMTMDEFHALQNAVPSTDAVLSAVSGYVNIDANQKAALQALSQGDYRTALKQAVNIGGNILGAPSGLVSDLIDGGKSLLEGNLIGAYGPLIGAALVATGVGAPIVAAVGGGIELAEAALTSLGSLLIPDQNNCRWHVGKFCVTTPRPFGPTDAAWRSYGQWQDLIEALGSKVPLVFGEPWPFASVDPFAFSVESEVRSLEKGTPSQQTSPAAGNKALDGFRLAFGRAYLANLEKKLNGHPAASEGDLLNQVSRVWGETHKGAPVTISGDGAPTGQTSDSSGVYKATIIEMILRGDLDGARRAPLVVKTSAGGANFVAAVKSVFSPVAAAAPTIKVQVPTTSEVALSVGGSGVLLALLVGLASPGLGVVLGLAGIGAAIAIDLKGKS